MTTIIISLFTNKIEPFGYQMPLKLQEIRISLYDQTLNHQDFKSYFVNIFIFGM